MVGVSGVLTLHLSYRSYRESPLASRMCELNMRRHGVNYGRPTGGDLFTHSRRAPRRWAFPGGATQSRDQMRCRVVVVHCLLCMEQKDMKRMLGHVSKVMFSGALLCIAASARASNPHFVGKVTA